MNEKKKEITLDYFRDTPVRYLGYANEVGEAFRQLIPVSFVRLSYVVASTYCLSDATSKAFYVKKEDLSTDKKSPNKKAIEMFIEAAVWQGLASVIIPGFTINRICWMSNIVIRSMMSSLLSPTRQKYLVTSIGLGCIPVIIKPIDRLVDAVIDSGVKLSKDVGVEHHLPHEEKAFHDIMEQDSRKKHK